jgi:hypothetical protein
VSKITIAEAAALLSRGVAAAHVFSHIQQDWPGSTGVSLYFKAKEATMSDFSYTATCPGCGQRFAPDDGACCVDCERCGQFFDRSLDEVIPALELARRGSNPDHHPKSLRVCNHCKLFNDVDAEKWWGKERAKRKARKEPQAIKQAWLAGADLEEVPDEDIPAELELLPGSTEVTRGS